MGYMFRLLFESSSGPQDVYPDIQMFTALWDPKPLQNKMYKGKGKVIPLQARCGPEGG